MADQGVRNFFAPGLTTREAADEVGVTVQKWHRLAAKHDVRPTYELEGIRGAKFWHPRDVERVAALLDSDGVAS